MRSWPLSAALLGVAVAMEEPLPKTLPTEVVRSLPTSFLDFAPSARAGNKHSNVQSLEDMFSALQVLQGDYYDADYGTWPTAIDWTAAFAQTLLSGALTTLTESLASFEPSISFAQKENLLMSYFHQLVGSYYGQDTLSIRGEAYDDILWVALGWLEAVEFVSTHSALHYPPNTTNSTDHQCLRQVLQDLPWHGHSWVPSFAHRSRIFWGLASRGWTDDLCHGGMVWNPRLSPYKNAITNELWISASIAMYQYFPGDNFTAPWLQQSAFPDRDPAHLAGAVEGYKWLVGVNMTNNQGLFVDGYHIDSRKANNRECDLRDEMVYTYNQGVILTGLRGLWSVTGAPSYLTDGHRLIQAVINATGWDFTRSQPVDQFRSGSLPPWRGIGRAGILEERCDASGTCSQDSQTFKAIFFHHLTAFCKPIETSNAHGIDQNHTAALHKGACAEYVAWTRHNAVAALGTRIDGKFGMWWGPGLFGNVMATKSSDGIDHDAANTTDYRDEGTPVDRIWGREPWSPGSEGVLRRQGAATIQENTNVREKVLSRIRTLAGRPPKEGNDPNARGRGRTVETQMGGLAVLRAYWVLSRSSESK
ncbi:glycosyl hydrolase family 76-domain-containing protein [Emericellopsis atlantica]|uniref:Glycosyl hydrolase family 76-domain-containing protein n=1 Tax=Emericellopsis atlantica TaxID=2614577 RepID=A0A9P8CSJ6_9HYPO|nr:glycosyl hydrolase family 76-domain-containing protein [Emericellopsis atlantica]KAG9258164.1 glycosyl hydrolase family 76-domain-containing protein [Emericellopsis atlantica]